MSRTFVALEPGEARVVFRRVGTRTVLDTLGARSPTRLLAPRNHGTGAWVFTSSFGGGLVDGDELRLDLSVNEGALALVGTQASTKVYRSLSGTRQEIVARVASRGTLLLLPDALSCFAGARFESRTDVELGEGASLALLELLTAGRSARGERWQFDAYASRIRVRHEGRLLFREATLLDPQHGPLEGRMGRFDALGLLVLAGPNVTALGESARAYERLVARSADSVLNVALLDGTPPVYVVRFAATSVETALRIVRGCLAELPALLGDDPFARKW